MDIFGVNALAVIVTAIIAFVFGMLWHSPVLFLKQWLRLMHISEKEMKKAKGKDMKPTYAIAFVVSLLLVWSIGFLLLLTGGYGAAAGLIIGGTPEAALIGMAVGCALSAVVGWWFCGRPGFARGLRVHVIAATNRDHEAAIRERNAHADDAAEDFGVQPRAGPGHGRAAVGGVEAVGPVRDPVEGVGGAVGPADHVRVARGPALGVADDAALPYGMGSLLALATAAFVSRRVGRRR